MTCDRTQQHSPRPLHYTSITPLMRIHWMQVFVFVFRIRNVNVSAVLMLGGLDSTRLPVLLFAYTAAWLQRSNFNPIAKVILQP